MRIVVLCASRRGLFFIERLAELAPEADLTVFSFREEPLEPLFLDDIRRQTEAIGGQFFEGRRVSDARFLGYWESTPFDLLFAVGWRYLVPASIYRRARLGAFVFHDSLLPAYRGFSPTVWAIINGERQTGATLIEMVDEVDAGDIVDQAAVSIGSDECIASLIERVTQTYLALLDRNLSKLLAGVAPRRKQDESAATYNCKRRPEDNRINWRESTESIFNLIRAVTSPYPGAYTQFDGQTLRVWAAKRILGGRRYTGRVPGRVVEVVPGEGVVVLTGDASLLLTKTQLTNGEPAAAANILGKIGTTLGV